MAVFDRSPPTGQLIQLAGTDGCVSETGTGGECANGRALDTAWDVTVSPDGANVYVAATLGGIAIFDRNLVTGELTQKAMTAGCIQASAAAGCTVGVAIGDLRHLSGSEPRRKERVLDLEPSLSRSSTATPRPEP